jgi:hypothetical protein
VSVVGETVYLLVERNGNYFIEKFDEALTLDSTLEGESDIATKNWAGLDHLEGEQVSVIADGIALDHKLTVAGGEISLNEAAYKIEVGLSYTHILEPLPPANNEGLSGRKTRLIQAIFRLQETQALRLDTGQGAKDIPLKQLGEDVILDAPPAKRDRRY